MAAVMNYDGSWVEVDLGQVQRNVAAIRARLGAADVITVVKSDAYGHGMEAVARVERMTGGGDDERRSA